MRFSCFYCIDETPCEYVSFAVVRFCCHGTRIIKIFKLFSYYIGYHVEKGTVIFINNHELSMSESLWPNAQTYKPSRFLKDNVKSDRELDDNNSNYEHNNTTTDYNPSNIESTVISEQKLTTPTKIFKKPAHFHPFSMGRRSCMGYKMVENVCYSIVSTLLQHFTFDTLTEADNRTTTNPEIQNGMLALAPEPFRLRLTKRQDLSTHFSETSPLQMNSHLRTRA